MLSLKQSQSGFSTTYVTHLLTSFKWLITSHGIKGKELVKTYKAYGTYKRTPSSLSDQISTRLLLTHPGVTTTDKPDVHLTANILLEDNSRNYYPFWPWMFFSNIFKWLTAQAFLNFCSLFKIPDQQNLSWLSRTAKIFFLFPVLLLWDSCSSHSFSRSATKAKPF